MGFEKHHLLSNQPGDPVEKVLSLSMASEIVNPTSLPNLLL